MATTIGLDIGSSAIRAVQVSTTARGTTLDRIGRVDLPAGAIRDGEIVDSDPIVAALRKLWSDHSLRGKRVALGLANQQVVVRQVDLPYLPEKELRQSLSFQVQDFIPIPVEQALLDFHILEQYELDDGRQFSRLLLVAAQKVMVETLLSAVRAAKLEPVLVDLDAFAILRTLAPPSVLESNEGELLIDVGAGVTNIVVHEDGVPRFVRILLMGGNSITENLVSALGLTAQEAEQAKIATGLVQTAGQSAQGADVARLIWERADRFIDEIRGSLDFYAAQAESVAVKRIVLTGGASQLRGLDERLSELLHLPVERGHPIAHLTVGAVGLNADELVAAESHLTVAIGLALGAAE